MLPVISKWSKAWLDPLKLYAGDDIEDWELELGLKEEKEELFKGKYKFTTGLSEFVDLPFDILYPGALRPILDIDDNQKDEIKKVFDQNITDGSGYNSFKNLQVALRGLGFEPVPRLLRSRIKKLGGDPWGPIPFDIFYTVLSTKMCRRSDLIEIYKSFRLLDRSKSKAIRKEDFIDLSREFGVVYNEDEAELLWEISDHNNDGLIRREDFVRILKLSGIYTTYYFKG